MNGWKVEASTGYALARYLARLWVNFSHQKIRLLRGDALATPSPVLLVLNGSPAFLHVAAVVAALERPVRFVIPQEACGGFWARWLAGRLGVILHGPSMADQSDALAVARDALRRGESVAVCAKMEPGRSESLSASCYAAAKLAARADSAGAAGPELAIIPLHVLSSYGAIATGEILLTAGSPISVREFLRGASTESSLRTLTGTLEERLSQNPYRLEDRDIQFFLADLEKVLRADLEEDWAAKPDWKQKIEGFEISRLMTECAEDLNARDPAQLAGLRIELEHYREELRRWSLHQLEVETAGEWIESPASRAWYWTEAILSAPVAAYGFLNHLIPLALLMPGNFFQRLARKDPGHAWLLRTLVILGSYFLQVSVCAHLWGRAAAGYYTLTLPLSGLVLWRFSRVVRTRVRLLVQARRLPSRKERVRELRKLFIEHLNDIRDDFAEVIRSSA